MHFMCDIFDFSLCYVLVDPNDVGSCVCSNGGDLGNCQVRFFSIQKLMYKHEKHSIQNGAILLVGILLRIVHVML